MPWFESSEEKQFRQLIQEKMEICISKPDKYQQGFPVLNSLVMKPNQKAIEMIVGHIKQVIKQDDYTPAQKLQAMILLRDLMASQSKALGKYVVTKILKRLIILAEHRKNEKDEKRGANIFKCKKSQQKYGIEFLKVLLLCLADWGKNWPRNADGPFHDFQVAYNDLLLEKEVAFPPEQKKASRSPAPTGFRASREQYGSSPPKMPMNQKRIENPLSKPVIKQKKVLTGPILQYVNEMIDLLELLSTTLKENPQFGDIWEIIKSFVSQFSSIDEQGNLLAAQMMQSGDQNQEISTIIQNNSIFIAKIKEDTRKVDSNKDNYGAYNNKYVTNCKRLILSLSMYTNKPSSTSLPSNSNSNNASATLKPQPVPVETSISERVEQVKPKVEAERNRYGSSEGLRNQLTNNLSLKKEDFNSGNLKQAENSQASSRYNSISGNPLGKHRDSEGYANNPSQKKQIKQPTRMPVQNAKSTLPKVEQLPNEKQDFFNQSDNQIKPKLQTQQIRKNKEKQNQSQKNFNDLDFEKPKDNQKKKNNDASFGEFEADSNSNSNFFREVENKNIGQMPMNARKNRKVGNKKPQQPNNFFDPFEEKSKPNSDNLSAFEKSKQQKSNSNSNSAQIKKQQSVEKKNETSKQQGFDTFKNPNEIAKAILELNKSVASNASKVSNPFSEHHKSKDNPFATKFEFGQNSFNRSQKSKEEDRKNEFNNDSGRFGQPNDNFPFGGRQISQIKPRKDGNDENQSKKSNPFSKYDQDNKSQEKSSIRSKPPIPRKKSELSANPFDAKSQNSNMKDNSAQRHSDKNANPFGTSFLSNPFDKPEKNNNSKQLSQRGSFVNVNNAGTTSMKDVNNVIDDPFFEPVTQVNKPTNTLSNSLQFNRRTSLQQKQKVQKSFDGFNFDDFPNVNDHRSSTSRSSVTQQKVQDISQKNNSAQLKGNRVDNVAVNNIFNQNIFEGTNQSQPIQQKPSNDSFNFFEQTKKVDESKDFFENSDKEIKQKIKQIPKKQDFQFGFDDFPNVSSNSNSRKESLKNPFSNFELSNGTIQVTKQKQQPASNEVMKQQPNTKQNAVDKQQLNKSEDSWNKFGKPSLNQSDIWNKFVNIQQKKSEYDVSPQAEIQQSRYEPSENKSMKSDTKQVPWFDEPKKDNQRQLNTNQHQAPQPHFGNSQKSISIHFQQVSAFQKKQIPWQHFQTQLSSVSYNINPQALEQKKQLFIKIEQENKSRVIKYREMNEKLNFLKKQYSKCLQKLSQSRQQKHEFLLILKRMQESNETKQRQIQQQIKKIKKAEQLKKKILENERILYERLKTEKKPKEPSTGSNAGPAGTKWERFNNNLRKQREMVQFGKTATNFSYYA